MNKKIYILILTIFTLFGCDTEIEYSYKHEIKLINRTSDKMIYCFISSFGLDTLFSLGSDSAGYISTEKISVKPSIIGIDRTILFPVPIIYHEEIYNLTDTTSYILSKGNNVIYSKIDSLYLYYNEKNMITGHDKVNMVDVYRIVYDYGFPEIMQKDSMMLIKFTDYYKQ